MPGNIGATKALAWVEEVIGGLTDNPQVMRANEMASFLERLGSTLIPGEPLETTTRSRMEAFLGYDLKDVLVHRGPVAEELSHRLHARAFTVGGHVFGSRQNLDISTSEGQGLLAHELTHAIQQTQPQPKLAETESRKPRSGSAPSDGYPEIEMALLTPAQSPDKSPSQREAEAQASERLAAESQENKAESPLRVDTEEIAERVYQLMRNDLVLERERAGRLGG